ncbi:hypothetical protein Tco_0439940 [Tanacetum coccineum]
MGNGIGVIREIGGGGITASLGKSPQFSVRKEDLIARNCLIIKETVRGYEEYATLGRGRIVMGTGGRLFRCLSQWDEGTDRVTTIRHTGFNGGCVGRVESLGDKSIRTYEMGGVRETDNDDIVGRFGGDCWGEYLFEIKTGRRTSEQEVCLGCDMGEGCGHFNSTVVGGVQLLTVPEYGTQPQYLRVMREPQTRGMLSTVTRIWTGLTLLATAQCRSSREVRFYKDVRTRSYMTTVLGLYTHEGERERMGKHGRWGVTEVQVSIEVLGGIALIGEEYLYGTDLLGNDLMWSRGVNIILMWTHVTISVLIVDTNRKYNSSYEKDSTTDLIIYRENVKGSELVGGEDVGVGTIQLGHNWRYLSSMDDWNGFRGMVWMWCFYLDGVGCGDKVVMGYDRII